MDVEISLSEDALQLCMEFSAPNARGLAFTNQTTFVFAN